jgi:hypothetical protein
MIVHRKPRPNGPGTGGTVIAAKGEWCGDDHEGLIGLPEGRATSLKLLDHDAGHDGAAVKLIHRDVEECSGGTALRRGD